MIQRILPIAVLLSIGSLGPPAWAVQIDRYAWEFPQVTNISGADDLIEDLREEIQRVLDAGHLAPIYISYSDQESVGYKVYQEPGRTITTLAWAYPYLTPTQQSAVRNYVATEVGTAQYAPWGPAPLPGNLGSPREVHPKVTWWAETNNFLYRPTVHTIYGLWLYAYRTGDWALIQTNWNSIKSMYSSRAGQGALYGTMGSHIAMARLAHRFNDLATRTTALSRLQVQLDTGLNFVAVETNAQVGSSGQGWDSPYASNPNMYDARMNSSTYRGWVFLNLSPELGRYLAEESPSLTAAVLSRHGEGVAMFPHWWVNKANYFNRSWTGDEGSGLVPDVFGMLAPVERWVVRATATTLRRQMMSAPTGVGDCYWLEALVQAIEVHGALTWFDVRSQVVGPPPSPPQGLSIR